MQEPTQPMRTEPPSRAPEYLRILNRYDGMDPALVRLSVQETSAVTRLAEKTLESMRAQGRGPAFLKLGRKIEYRLVDIQEFMEKSLFRSTREAKTAKCQERSDDD